MALVDYSTKAKKILYLFTSTEPPYHKDALDILALPSGVSYRFRYALRYLPTDLQTLKQFEEISKDAMLVHVKTTPLWLSTTRADIKEHFPIREAKIIDIKFVGNFVWIEFILGDWIKYVDSSIHEYHKLIVDVMPAYQTTKLNYTVVAAPPFKYEKIPEDLSLPYENSNVVKSWSNLTDLLMKTGSHNDSIFLKFASLQQIDTQDSPTRLKPEILGNKVYGFKMKKNTSYRVEILQKTKKNPTTFDLEILTNEDDITPIQKTDKIQGKYDVLDFIIRTKSLERTHRSFFLIRPEKGTASQVTIPRLHFDLDIIVSKFRRTAVIFILGTGVFISGMANAIQEGHFSLELALPAVIGGVMSSIAVYLLRK